MLARIPSIPDLVCPYRVSGRKYLERMEAISKRKQYFVGRQHDGQAHSPMRRDQCRSKWEGVGGSRSGRNIPDKSLILIVDITDSSERTKELTCLDNPNGNRVVGLSINEHASHMGER